VSDDREVPDVAGPVEYADAGNEFLRHALAVRGRAPERLILFPYPNTPPKLRQIAVPTFPDMLELWMSAGRIGRITDPQLSGRVFGRRLAKKIKGGGWHFRNLRRAWDAFVTMVDDCTPKHGEICNTDVANYYGSINLDLLEKQLRDLGCPPADVRTSMSIFENWQARDGLKGLPVALDSSSVLGTAFLRDVDVELERRCIIHGRWVDDIVMVGAARGACRAARDVVALTLATLGLTLSEQKTYFDSRSDGLARLRSKEISLIEAVGRMDSELEEELILDAFEEILAEGEAAEGRKTRWLLAALAHRGERYSLYRLATNPGVMNVDPAATGKFFKRFFRREDFTDHRIVPALCEVLITAAIERTHALHLHLMRALTTVQSLGMAEGAVFERHVFDVGRPMPVRCWALHAYAITPRWSARRIIDFAEAEADSRVRRAAVLTLKSRVSTRRLRPFLDHVDRMFPDIRITTAYVRRAA